MIYAFRQLHAFLCFFFPVKVVLENVQQQMLNDIAPYIFNVPVLFSFQNS